MVDFHSESSAVLATPAELTALVVRPTAASGTRGSGTGTARDGNPPSDGDQLVASQEGACPRKSDFRKSDFYSLCPLADLYRANPDRSPVLPI